MAVRRRFMLAVGVTLIASLTGGLPVRAQQKRSAVIGFLGPASAAAYAGWLESMKVTLRELGYIEGRDVRLEARFGDGSQERLPQQAAELVRLRVDVIVTSSTAAALAAKRATSTIPIVTALISDPVDSGVVASLSRPGGNVTGTAFLLRELHGKRLEVLMEAVPKIKRVAFFANPENASAEIIAAQAYATARKLGVELVQVDVRRSIDVEAAFTEASRRVDAALFTDDPVFNAAGRRLGELSLERRIPAIGFDSRVAEGGALMAYGVDQHDMFRRAARYVDKILKGANPAELPVERSSRFLLTVNQKTARALDIRVPGAVLLRADRVIE